MGAVKAYMMELSEALGYGGEFNSHVERVFAFIGSDAVDPDQLLELIAVIHKETKPSKLLTAAIAALELLMLDENGQLRIDTSENIETETEVDAVRGMLQTAIADAQGGAA